jgi:hypothetical protein
MEKIYIGYDQHNKFTMEDNLSRCFGNTDYFISTDTIMIEGKYIYHLILTAMLDADYVFDISDKVVQDIQDDKCFLLFDYTFESRNNSIQHEYDQYKSIIDNTLSKYNLQKPYIYVDGNPYNSHDLDLYFNRFIVEVGRACLHPIREDSDVMVFEVEQSYTEREYKISSFNRRPDENRFKFVDAFKDNPDVLCTLGKPDEYDMDFYTQDFPELVPMLPMEYDLSLDLEVPNLVSIMGWELQQLSYIQVVNESLFHYNKGHMFINEKTLKPLACLQPFILNGMPGSLKHLHELGFKTFGKWWDESYDSELDFVKRTDKIIDIVTALSNLTHNNLIDMLQDMNDILLHNRNHLVKLPREHSIGLYNQIINTGY